MTRSIRLCLFCFLPLLASCGLLSPSYERPDAGLPAGYALAEGLPPLDDGGRNLAEFTPENRDWWRRFASPVLPELQKAALAANHDFAARRWSLAQTMAQARVSRARLLPSIDVSASTSRRGSERGLGYSVTDSVSGTVQAGYEVDLWGKNFESWQAREYTALAGLNTWRGAGLSLESEVALVYFSCLAARANLAVYDAMLRNAYEVLTYQEKREALGAATPLDVARQRQAVESMEAERIGYVVRLNEARNNLALLLGTSALPMELREAMDGERLLDLLPPDVTPGLPAELLARRPDIMEAEARLLAANANIGVARANFLPGINLTASTGWSSDALDALIHPANALYSLAASFLQPIFSGGSLLAQYDDARFAKEELIERYKQTTLAAFWEVSTALSSVQLLEEQETRRVASAAQADEAYRIARVRYESGAEDFLAVLSAQDTMLSAQNSLVSVRLERLNTTIALFKALGGGWGEVEVEMEVEDASGGQGDDNSAG